LIEAVSVKLLADGKSKYFYQINSDIYRAKTIIVGRARLRGLHIGVIATETNKVDVEIPADPASEDSQARLISQAGQVWYPDSAYKVRRSIKSIF
jgi:acetyl-CoA carboxylase carboxyltransferase component